ncbi:MAG: type IV secretory system conjugative DNA transfer family protein, partial [Actinobacteria bacterium]|nr:type IV secretory system conjugative DNA transfer family protein [Actinomycetota bacterium]
PYYQDGARALLDGAMQDGAEGLEHLIARFRDSDSDVDNQVRKGTLARYRSFSAAAGEHLCGQWAFEDTRASYILLDGVALGDDTPRLARYLLEDFQHYAAARKPAGRRALLVVDEFSALRVPDAASLLERLRSFNVGVVIASQSVEGLHDDPNERARLLGAASTVVAHRLADPEPVCARAGTVQRTERSHQLDHLGATGMGSLRIQGAYRIDPNDLRNLPAGVAWITTGDRAAKVCVARGAGPPAPPHPNRRFVRGPRGGLPPRDRRGGERGGRGDPGLGRPSVVVDGPEEVTFVEARLILPTGADDGLRETESTKPAAVGPTRPAADQQALPLEEPPCDVPRRPNSGLDGEGQVCRDPRDGELSGRTSPPKSASPYAQGL